MPQPVRRRLPQSFGGPLGGLTGERKIRDRILEHLLDDVDRRNSVTGVVSSLPSATGRGAGMLTLFLMVRAREYCQFA